MNINKIICTGRLTKDPELRQVSEEMKVCQLRLAVDGMGRGREVGYVNVAVFGKAGEAAKQYLAKGWLVAVDGRLEYGGVGERGWRETPRLHGRRKRRVPDRPPWRSRPSRPARGRSPSRPELPGGPHPATWGPGRAWVSAVLPNHPALGQWRIREQ